MLCIASLQEYVRREERERSEGGKEGRSWRSQGVAEQLHGAGVRARVLAPTPRQCHRGFFSLLPLLSPLPPVTSRCCRAYDDPPRPISSVFLCRGHLQVQESWLLSVLQESQKKRAQGIRVRRVSEGQEWAYVGAGGRQVGRARRGEALGAEGTSRHRAEGVLSWCGTSD